jgi:hypothetical protein
MCSGKILFCNNHDRQIRHNVVEEMMMMIVIVIAMVIIMLIADLVAMQSKVWVLSTCTVKYGFESRLGHEYLSLVSLCCVVLCM